MSIKKTSITEIDRSAGVAETADIVIEAWLLRCLFFGGGCFAILLLRFLFVTTVVAGLLKGVAVDAVSDLLLKFVAHFTLVVIHIREITVR